ncbi:hypothetical protein HQN60_06190 [Deefgea piscis]|uniref:Macro domain-containing protein n=1 Tax=Deefgea piscis TaxID=2739061 RepID=A0A6M8SMH3_9NEIS|nr:macro domain-containing protein [Deefgea piscis]QKJ66325.1 hypothetical protein HQN60_06190 [Deefgea piscis]
MRKIINKIINRWLVLSTRKNGYFMAANSLFGIAIILIPFAHESFQELIAKIIIEIACSNWNFACEIKPIVNNSQQIYVLIGIISCILTGLYLYHKGQTPPKNKPNKRITPQIDPIGSNNNVKLFSYCGSILHINNIEVVVTSENQWLNIGTGESMSSRIRILSSEKDEKGQTIICHIEKEINYWKKNKGIGPYQTGETIEIKAAKNTDAYARGVRHTIHAVALKKCSETGEKKISETTNKKIIDKCLKFCEANNISSIFIPIFGLGAGEIDEELAIPATINPIINGMKEYSNNLDVYFGTYREGDAEKVKMYLEDNL